MNAIEIVFTGLVYLFGTSTEEQPGSVQVILPNVSEASAPFGQVIPPHYAYVKVRTADIVNLADGTAEREPDFVYKKGSGPEYAIFGLSGDRITLAEQTVDPLTICRDDFCGMKLDDVTLKLTYARIPHRGVVCPQCTNLDPLYLSTKDPALVLGRITVDHGRLSSAHIDPDSEWSFEPMHRKTTLPDGAKYPTQFVADQVVLDVMATTGKNIILSITPFDAKRADIVTLELKDKAEVEIGNLMFEDVVPFLLHHGPEAVDRHFAHFYTMLLRPFTQHPDAITDPRIPHRIKFPPHDPGGARQNCVPLADEP
jgi:hypothetical protein